MSKLEETFGETFAQEYKQTEQQRRQELEKVSPETKRKVAEALVASDDFSGSDPHMTFESDSGVTHDVLLMTLPEVEDGTIFQYRNELSTGAVSIPMDYIGSDGWMSVLFNDKEMVKGMTEGQQYVIIGNLDQWEKDDGEMEDQVSPARGVLTLEEVEEYAQSEASQEVNEEEPSSFNETEAEEEETETEDGEEDDEDSSFSTSFGDDEEEEDEGIGAPSDDTIHGIIDELAEQKPEVAELTADDGEELEEVATYIMQQEGYDEYDDEVAQSIIDTVLDYVTEDEEEEEDDDGGLLGDNDADDLFS